MLWALMMLVSHHFLALDGLLYPSEDDNSRVQCTEWTSDERSGFCPVNNSLVPYTEWTSDERTYTPDWDFELPPNSYKESPNDKAKYTLAVSPLQKLCQAEQGKNFVFSPLSLGTAFGMLTAGLRGEAKAELLQFLGAVDDSELHSMFSDVLSKRGLPLKMSNKYLADERFEIRQEFKSLLKEKYESEIESVDFQRDARRIEKDANTWVAEKTNNRIPKLLQEGILKEDTILVILNAIYFKGSWFEEFDQEQGFQNFKLRSGEEIQRHFITKESDEFGYAETGKLRLVKIPYKEAGFYMLVAIPKNENDHIDDIIADMQPTELITVIKESKHPKNVILSMPKFKIEYNFKSVQQTMKELGVKKIFVPGAADFGNLFTMPPGGVSVDSIIHKAVIEVDEKGTTAAAATAMHLMLLSARFPVQVILNRPFLYMVMLNDDLVCFAGICAQP